MLEDGRTWLLAVDFDEEAWREDAAAFREICLCFEITPAVERSRSWNGAHVWFFFSEPVPAADARRLGSGLLTQAMARRHELRFAAESERCRKGHPDRQPVSEEIPGKGRPARIGEGGCGRGRRDNPHKAA